MKSSTPTNKGADRYIYQPVGRCIYCGSDDDLGDERIIPFRLGAKYILPKSICKSCQLVIGRVEDHVLRGMFWPTRSRKKIQSRRKAPEYLTATIMDADGAEKTLKVSPPYYPDHLFMMNLKPPGILDGLSPEQRVSGMIWGVHPGGDRKISERVVNLGARSLESKLFPLGIFSRMLAKIAHAHAMSDVSLEHFFPFLPHLILGSYGRPSYLIGCLWENPPEPERNVLHRINSQVTTMEDKGRFLLCRIRLFANLGTPEYCVVVGQLR